MTIITAQSNQSMLDVIIQATGSLEAGMQFCVDNGVGISDVPVAGVVYVVSDAALALGDSSVLQYLAKNGNEKGPYQIGTLNLQPVVEIPLMNDDGVNAIGADGGLGNINIDQ